MGWPVGHGPPPPFGLSNCFSWRWTEFLDTKCHFIIHNFLGCKTPNTPDFLWPCLHLWSNFVAPALQISDNTTDWYTNLSLSLSILDFVLWFHDDFCAFSKMLNSIVKQLESINNAQFVVQNFKIFAVEQPGTPFYRGGGPTPRPSSHSTPPRTAILRSPLPPEMLAGKSTPISLHLQHA